MSKLYFCVLNSTEEVKTKTIELQVSEGRLLCSEAQCYRIVLQWSFKHNMLQKPEHTIQLMEIYTLQETADQNKQQNHKVLIIVIIMNTADSKISRLHF